ncbi:MAG: hypothetical protein V4450_08205 [Bacteroidota bacterium]
MATFTYKISAGMRQGKAHLDPKQSPPDKEGKGKVAAKKGSGEILESVKSSGAVAPLDLYKVR